MMQEARSSAGIGRLSLVASGFFAVTVLIKAAADLNIIRVLGGFGAPIAPMPVLKGADAVMAAATLLYLVSYVAVAMVILRWVFVTNRNAQAWSAFVSVTPGWNVGWFFVPIANLLKPFEGVRETYQASVDPQEPAGVPVPLAMRIWWAAWLVGGFVGYFVFLTSARQVTPAGVISTHWKQVIFAAVVIVQTVALTSVIRRTTRAQLDRLHGGGLAAVFH